MFPCSSRSNCLGVRFVLGSINFCILYGLNREINIRVIQFFHSFRLIALKILLFYFFWFNNRLGGETLAVVQSGYCAKWFKSKELALAFGLTLSCSRLVCVNIELMIWNFNFFC